MKIGFLLLLSMNDIEALMSANLTGKTQSFLLELPNYYISKGHEVIIITTSNRIKEDYYIKQDNLTIHIIKIGSHGRVRAFTGFRSEIRRIASVLKKENCTIMHAHWCYEFAMAAISVDKDKTIVTLHDWPDTVCPLIGNYFWKKRQILGNKVLEKAKYFTAVSPYIANLHLKRYPTGSVTVVPNFISMELLNEKEKYLNYESPVLVSINNGFNNIKNTKVLIDAFAIVKTQIPNAVLRLYGTDYQEGGPACIWANQNSDIEGIEFMGSVSHKEVSKVLRNSDILVHTSVEESFGMTLIEAMASKTAVVAGKDSGAVPWVLGYGQYGKLADIQDKDDIAYMVIELCENLGEWDGFTSRAYSYVQETFPLETCAELYFKEYEKICGCS